MNTIKIDVGKSIDGYVFSIGPTIRNLIKERFPNAHPANRIFVNYDIRSGFEKQIQKLENYLYPALLGVESKSDLDNLYEIHFVDPLTEVILYKANTKDSNKLNRFTTLPFLIQLLQTHELTLLNPKTWEDHNDSDILLNYQAKKFPDGSVLALCFTDGPETIHHWKNFSNGESGCCIEFDKKALLKSLPKDKEILHDKVEYVPIKKSTCVPIERIPFTKRLPYECEHEYRIIMNCETKELKSYSFKISLKTITKITLSPTLPNSTFEVIKPLLARLNQNNISIVPSTLFENKKWIEGFKSRLLI